MAKKKFLMVVLDIQRRNWRIVIEGADRGALDDIAKFVTAMAEKRDLAVLNGVNPFSAVKPRVRKAKKLNSGRVDLADGARTETLRS